MENTYDVLGNKYSAESKVVTDSVYAREVRKNIETILDAGEDETVVIDLSKVDAITVKCAAEIFGKLWRNLGEDDYSRRVRIKGASAEVEVSVDLGIRKVEAYCSNLRGDGRGNAYVTCDDAMSMFAESVRSENAAYIRMADRKITEAARGMKSFVDVEFLDKDVNVDAIAAYYEYMGFTAFPYRHVLGESSLHLEWCDRRLS